MKNIIFIVPFLLLVTHCKKVIPYHGSINKTILSDTVSKAPISEIKFDTLTKKSEPFELNKMVCYWEHFFNIYEDYGLEITMKLINHKTKEILLELEYQPKYVGDYNYKYNYYFKEINERHFMDVNFDGYKDFTIYSYGSMPMTSATNIYVFDTEAMNFYSNENEILSDNIIQEVDSINNILITSSFDSQRYYERIHHFDKKGKIIYSEYVSEEEYYPNDSIRKLITTYQKKWNGKEGAIKIDTINAE